ncbi:forkhead box protein J1-like [Apus apus]|uniref:forkhead box protein J1-like n=1 Tax=Apus apus TaxID=8895 RepID=UPI0021F83955|nr:forkhead box protein J1-like [Apus apus]
MAEGWPDDNGKGRKRCSASMDSLPSLTWLTEFSVKDTHMARPPWIPDPLDRPRAPSFAAPCSPLAADPACMGVPHTPCHPISSSSSSRPVQHTMATCPQLAEDMDYKTNPHLKPPYSYASLICMAMEASGKPKITLSAIYQWIMDNFCYFRHADPTWQNSIRHNLSLNKCFIRVPREKDEPGKGGFWKMDPLCTDQLKKGSFRKRRRSPGQIHPAFTKTAHQEPQCDASPATSVCTPTNVLGGSRESQQLLEELAETPSSQTWDPSEGQAGQRHQQLSPNRPAKVARLSNSALLTQEEQEELGSLKGDLDWEGIFDTNLNADLPTFEDLDLLSPTNPTVHDLDLTVPGQHTEGPQGQEQVQTESHQKSLGWDETFMAAAFLQNPWDEGTNDCLNNTVNMEEVFEWNDTPLPEAGKGKGL